MLLALIKKEILCFVRDPGGLLLTFLMPAAFIVIMSLVLRDVYLPANPNLPYSILDQDDTPVSKELIKNWQKNHPTSVPLANDWQTSLAKGNPKYVLKIHSGFTRALLVAETPTEVVVEIIAEPGIDQNVLLISKMELALICSELRAFAMNPRAQHSAPSILEVLDAKRLPSNGSFSRNNKPVTAVQYNVPAWLIFGMFFIVVAMSSLFIEERKHGVLTRLIALGVPHYLMILAKAIPYLLINALQATLMLAVGVWLMPLLGGDALQLSQVDWGALGVMLLAISAAAVSLALFFACLLSSHNQASTVGPILNSMMAALGGIMVPVFVMPHFMQRLAVYSPMNWALDGMLQVTLRSGTYTDILSDVVKLFVFAVAFFILACWSFWRVNTPRA